MNKAGFIAINLDQKSVEMLKENFPPRHKKEFYHHLTIAFKPTEELYQTFEPYFGSEVELPVIGEVFDHDGQAVLVECDLSTNEAPHITLSCADRIPPNYANALAEEKENFISHDKNLVLTGKIIWEGRN